MKFFADFHVHSGYARACSKQISFEKLEEYARIKGMHLLGTGDFQHPQWNKIIKEKLTEDDNGILWTKTKFPFLWQTEVSLMYTQGGKGRRIHHVILAPNQLIADQITEALGKKGRLDYDGRPIFGFTSIELVDMMRSISHDIEIIPAHCMTPWFGLFGSKSGFDSLQECFEENTKYIHAIETGLSADPPMLLRFVDPSITLVSSSDLHSFWPWRMGREATVLDCPMTYKSIVHALRTKEGLHSTIEVDPSYGKYHFDGHRNCGVSFSPEETRKLKGVCPKCNTALTIGVQYRVEELAKHPEGYAPKETVPYVSYIPLTEIIAKVLGMSMLSSKKVWTMYNQLIKAFGNEFAVLGEISREKLLAVTEAPIVNAIMQNRSGNLTITPGYDGVYGVATFDKEPAGDLQAQQKSLGDF